MILHPGVQWLLFDAVGTLIYPDPPVAEVYALAARSYGSHLSAAEISQRFHAAFVAHATLGGLTSEAYERQRWQKIVAATIDDVPEPQIDGLFEHLWNHFAQAQHWRLYDDVAPALAALSARGYQLGIASNFDQRLLAIVAGHPPLAACQAVFVSSQIGHCKPGREFFIAIERKLGVGSTALALVGDDEISDIQGASTSGWTAVRLSRGPCRPQAIRSLLELL
jgi:putative hydrolase of the HAD superfamily